MTTEQAISYYGSKTALADKLGIHQAAVSQWGKYPPPLRQKQLEEITRRELKAEPNIYRKRAA
jgi:DNA-binding transcriptional regulator YdaS (Cro superfamily)